MEEQERKQNIEKLYEDEIVVANMNVEGMPWYTPSHENGTTDKGAPPSRRETLRMMAGALKAALLIGGAFAAGLLAFLLFCVYVWFR